MSNKLNKIKKIKKARFALPNLVTLGSVFCSFLSMSFSLNAQNMVGQERIDTFLYAALAIIGSIIFDTFDGKVARWTHTSTKFGMELDSLADGVSFGVTPAILLYSFALNQLGIFGLIASFLFVSGALLRLARFNIEAPEEGVQTYFKGIPAPGGAACIAAIVLGCIDINFVEFSHTELNILACIAIGVGLLMISNVKYKTLKGKKTKYDWAYVIVGILFFGVMCFLKTPSIAFFALACYFVLFGMLNSIYLNLSRVPRRKHRRKTVTDMPVVTSNSEVKAEENTEAKAEDKTDAEKSEEKTEEKTDAEKSED